MYARACFAGDEELSTPVFYITYLHSFIYRDPLNPCLYIRSLVRLPHKYEAEVG